MNARVCCRIALFLFPVYLGAQTTQPVIEGAYFLRGVMEVASAYRFNADSTFDFYFSYGAIDRYGKGTYDRQGDSLILYSPPKPERDFILESEKKTDDERVIIQVKDQNPMVLPYVLCRLLTPQDSILQGQSDREGYIFFDKTPVKSISLLHQLWPDRPSVFQVTDPADNFFVFAIDPHIIEVDFNGVVLHLAGNALEGPHPLLEPGKVYRFEKE